MATTTQFSIPFSSPYTFNEEINFKAFYTGEGLYYVKTRVIGYNAHQLIIGVRSQRQKERKVVFNISADILQVSCNCKSEKGTLCAHGFHALHDLCWNSKAFFTIFELITRKSDLDPFLINNDLITSLANLAYSTSRGIIFTKCQGTIMKNLIIPVLSTQKLIELFSKG